MSVDAESTDRGWYITQRWQQYEGEARANLLRIIAIGTFYAIHLWNYFSSRGVLPDWGFLQLAAAGEIDRRFHVLVTLLAISDAPCIAPIAAPSNSAPTRLAGFATRRCRRSQVHNQFWQNIRSLGLSVLHFRWQPCS